MSSEQPSSDTNNKLLTGCLLGLAAIVVMCVLVGVAVPSIGGSLVQSILQASARIIQLPPPTPAIVVLPAVIDQIKPLGQLHTASYFLSTVVDTQMPIGVLNQIQRVLLVACGKVDAGIDLAKLEPQNIITSGEKVVIRLPEAELFTSQLFDDRKCTYVVMREEGILLPPNTALETAAREAAVANFRETALANGLLDQARVNAEGELRRLLTMLGYRDIQFAPPKPLINPYDND
ncbi:MAG: DUF4230 domain-containing protein [Chloroflexi bacterium]|nr:DUF4230 domain-containing protein [Chloroflexota bacterium]